MLDQFDTFSQSPGANPADSNALYFIRGGQNDFDGCGDTSCTAAQIASFNANISSLITALADKGAKHFFLSGISGTTGNYRAGFNKQLLATASSLSASLALDITFFDYAVFSAATFVSNNPYGFTSLYPMDCYTGGLSGVGGSLCSNVWAYDIWDSHGHFTSRAARVAGNAFANQIIIP